MKAISILVVEDEAMTAMYMETMLKRKGYNVLKCVSTGEEAVEFALSNIPDVIIMDIRLAGKMNGIEAVEKIKAVTIDTVKFMFTTGYSDAELMETSMKLGPIGFFVKPVNLSEISNVIESFFLIS